MNEHNRAILLARIERIDDFLRTLRQAIDGDVRANLNENAGALARQMKLLLDEVEAAEDGC